MLPKSKHHAPGKEVNERIDCDNCLMLSVDLGMHCPFWWSRDYPPYGFTINPLYKGAPGRGVDSSWLATTGSSNCFAHAHKSCNQKRQCSCCLSLPEPISRNKDWIFMGTLFRCQQSERWQVAYRKNSLDVSSQANIFIRRRKGR